MQTYQIKSKPNSGFRCGVSSPPPVVCSPRGLNSVILAQRRVSPVRRRVLGFQFSCFCLNAEVCFLVLVPVRWGGSRSDAGELVPEARRQDALHLLHDEVQRSKQRAEELRRGKQHRKINS
ncbi:hypothetical protein F2P81_006281 [Scophthalmus maximus]|uniref:Uncharacterized protein n=1 Tax=Scophthalmus maximus TaxID=52904 RepID=A0A6A4T2T8_SCOMX|nr:hypothetical protein F2P81_006281 [Scophthalmus maximus]